MWRRASVDCVKRLLQRVAHFGGLGYAFDRVDDAGGRQRLALGGVMPELAPLDQRACVVGGKIRSHDLEPHKTSRAGLERGTDTRRRGRALLVLGKCLREPPDCYVEPLANLTTRPFELREIDLGDPAGRERL